MLTLTKPESTRLQCTSPDNASPTPARLTVHIQVYQPETVSQSACYAVTSASLPFSVISGPLRLCAEQ